MTEQKDFGARCSEHMGSDFLDPCPACIARNQRAEQVGVFEITERGHQHD